MRNSDAFRWSGLAAMVGGAFIVAAAVLHSFEPRGCIGAECATRPFRESSALVNLLALSAGLLVAVGLAGLVLLAKQSGRFSALGVVGVVLGAAGFAVLFLSGVVQAVFFDGDFPLMPLFVIPGLLGMMVGFILIGIVILKAKVLPRWAATALIIASVLMVGANEQTLAVLLFIPLGLVWLAVGYLMWSRKDTAVDRAGGIEGAPA